MQYFHFKQNKNQYTFHRRSNVRRQSFQIVSPKIYHVTQRHPLTMGCRHVGFRMLLFFPQNKIDALKKTNARHVGSWMVFFFTTCLICSFDQATCFRPRCWINIIINIQGQITNCPHKSARLAGENEFWRAANHIASALLLIGSSDPEAFLKLDMIYWW